MSAATSSPPPARCTFYVRTAVEGRNVVHGVVVPDGWRYDAVPIRSPDGSLSLLTHYPPAVGDTIFLHGSGVVRVVFREWLHSTYGSMNWPAGTAEPIVGPDVTCIVEPAPGLFVDEVAEGEEA